ncbi:MAG: ATP-grasp domain-containing protein [Actinomycetia bacterium]|nr:ATP-grasp domain-containing protein [Actinomycetes bacterium]
MNGSTPPVVVAHVPVSATPYGEPVRPHVRLVIVDALRRAGHDVADLAIRSRADLDGLAAAHPGCLVFNLCYGLKGSKGRKGLDQPGIAAAMVERGLAVVGSDAETQRRCQDKVTAAELVAAIGVESPRQFNLDEAVIYDRPLVVKPRAGAAHRDVRLITDPTELVDAPPAEGAFIQEYLDGPEYTVGVIGDGRGGLMTLPVMRIRNKREGTNPAVYNWSTTTWAPDASGRFGLASTSIELFECLGLQDYARFDFRVVAGRGPVLLDANALPNLAPRQLLATSARWAGLQYPELINRIMDSARDRLTIGG